MAVKLNVHQRWLIDAVEGTAERLAEAKPADDTGILGWMQGYMSDLPDMPSSIVGLPAWLLEADTWYGWAFRKVVEAFAGLMVLKDTVGIAATPGIQQLHAKLPFEIPDVGTLNLIRQWNSEWADGHIAYMAKHGFDEDHAYMIFDAGLPKPGVGEVLGAWYRRHGMPLADEDANTPYAWANRWSQLYIDEHTALPSVADISTMHRRQLIDDNERDTLLRRTMYAPDISSQALSLVESTLSPADVIRIGWRWNQGPGDVGRNLYRVGWDRGLDAELEELTYSVPSPMDLARYHRRRGATGDIDRTDLKWLGQHPKTYSFIDEMSWAIPGPADVARHAHRKGLTLPSYSDTLSRVGLHPAYHETIDDLVQARPSPAEWFAYRRRVETVPYTDHDALRRLGYDPEWWPTWETLSHPMPGVSDLVMMAVREVFTPEVAEAFGQFKEIPDAYITNAAKIGLSEEWAKNYWAAHWTLPSVMQGFDMLHRGIIDPAELKRLFVALDIMPFWRDRLTDISYRLLTRVDVRRMYREGVLTYDDTLAAYVALGYSELNAARMTDFTVSYVRRQEIGFTRSQVLRAYRDRAIDAADARDMLELLGIAGEDADFALAMEDFNTATEVQNENIKIIETEYKKGILSFEDASIRLDGLEVLPERKTLLLNRWSAVKASKQRVFTKSEIMRYLVNGAIDYATAGRELEAIGYSSERVLIMLSAAAMNAVAVRGKRRQLSMGEMVDMLAAGIVDLTVFREMLEDYGWRDPELSMHVCRIAMVAKVDLPEGTEPCTPESVLGMLSLS